MQHRIVYLGILPAQESLDKLLVISLLIIGIETQRTGMNTVETDLIKLIQVLMHRIDERTVSADHKNNFRFIFIINIPVRRQCLACLSFKTGRQLIRPADDRILFHIPPV